MLLNLTSRRSAEKIIPRLFARYPTPQDLADADEIELAEIVAPLGLKNRRSKSLVSMAKKYVSGSWKHPRELPGVGEYAATAWQIFIDGTLPPQCPKDGALTAYYKWRMSIASGP